MVKGSQNAAHFVSTKRSLVAVLTTLPSTIIFQRKDMFGFSNKDVLSRLCMKSLSKISGNCYIPNRELFVNDEEASQIPMIKKLDRSNQELILV